MTSGIAAVQARISEISSMFGSASPISASASQAASATATTSATGTSVEGSFAQAMSAATTGTTTAATGAPVAGTATEQKVVAQAQTYLGIPYVWGGTDPSKGLDCSGFVQNVYQDMGIDIPRVSGDQAKAGRPVASLAEARPGDLVFYDYSSSRSGIDHVAMYIGDGKIIEAARPGTDIKISDVGNPAAIRRLLPEEATSARTALPTIPTAALSALTGTTPAASAAPVAAGLSGVPYADLFTTAGAKHGVPAALLAAVAKTESGFNPSAVSSAGAQGLMQFMPATAQGMGVNPLDPASAVDGAARYLSSHLREFGSIEKALAAYNAGPGTVRKYGGVPPYPETQNYVTKVTDAWETYR